MFNALLFKKHPGLYKQKIGSTALRNYYLMIILLIAAFFGWYRHQAIIAIICFAGWLYLVSSFILKRLKNTSLSVKHIIEMVATSMLIPFISVFWNWYGIIKFKALRL